MFAIEVRSHPKSHQILHALASKFFFGGKDPRILDWHKMRITTNHHAKFHANRATELGDLVL